MLDLLHSFFRKREVSPATSLTATRRWISTLPLQDEYEAHHMIVEALNLFNSSTEPLNRERLKVLMRLDESCQALQDSLCRQYLKNQKTLKHAEKALWKEIFALYWHLAHGYQAFIREVINNRGNSELSSYLPLMTTRAMHYFGMEVKWRYFHQEAIEPNMWRRLHKLYRIGESAGFAREKLQLASGDNTTCADEYVQILLLDLLTPTSLKPSEIELIDRMLNDWSRLVTLEREFNPAWHTYLVDLAEGGGADRLGGDSVSGEKLRYLSLNGIQDELAHALQGLRAGDPPEKHGLLLCSVPQCMDFLDQVATLWQRGSSTRALPREHSRRPVEVVCGLAALKARLKPGAKAVDDAGNASEYWALENESDRGVGLKIDSPGTENPAIGHLIGIRTLGGGEHWEVGAVRWVTSTDTVRLSLGVEKLSQSPRLVELRTVENPLVEPGGAANAALVAEALFLPRVDEHGMASSLILPGEKYFNGRLLDLHDSNVIYRIRLTSLMEQADEWARAKFDILGRRQI